MEKEDMIHQGRGVHFFRRYENIPVEQFAGSLEISPEELLQLEDEPVWADEVLRKAAKALDRPFGLLKVWNPSVHENREPKTIINNTFNDESTMSGSGGNSTNGGDNIVINTFDKVVDSYREQISDLKEMIAGLKSEIEQMKKKP